MTDRVAIAIILAGLAASWVTMIPLNAVDPFAAVVMSPQIVWNLGITLALAVLVSRASLPLGVLVGYVGVNAVRAPYMARPWTMATTLALGALAFMLIAGVSIVWRLRARYLLVASGLGQVALVILQRLGWDPIWATNAPYKAEGLMVGTLGNPSWCGEFLAIISAIAPTRLVPVFGLGIWLTGSRISMATFIVVVMARLWLQAGRQWSSRAMGMASVAIAGTTFVALWSLATYKGFSTFATRWHTWTVGLGIWWQEFILFGSGTGGWAWYTPHFRERFTAAGVTEAFTNPHNLLVGVLFEHGLVGLALLGWLVWHHRRQLAHSPVAWAIGVLSLASFPLYVAQVAGPALIALAVTWPKEVDPR